MTSYRGEAETKGQYPPRVTGRLDVVIRGYDRLQVDRLLDRLSREMSILRADPDAAAARVEKAAEDLAAAMERSVGVFGDSDISWALGTNGQGDYGGLGSYFLGEEQVHVFFTSASSTGPLRTLMPLSGDPADFSSAHAVTSGKVAVGGGSESESGKVHATPSTNLNASPSG